MNPVIGISAEAYIAAIKTLHKHLQAVQKVCLELYKQCQIKRGPCDRKKAEDVGEQTLDGSPAVLNRGRWLTFQETSLVGGTIGECGIR